MKSNSIIEERAPTQLEIPVNYGEQEPTKVANEKKPPVSAVSATVEKPNTLTSGSDYILNSSGSIVQNWDRTHIYPSKLVEVFKETVLLECLMDSEKKIFKLRHFKRSVIEGMMKLEFGVIILIKTFERAGKQTFEYEKGAESVYGRYFEIEDVEAEDIFGKDMNKG